MKIEIKQTQLMGAIDQRVKRTFDLDMDNPYFRENITEDIYHEITCNLTQTNCKWLGVKENENVFEVHNDNVLKMIYIALECKKMDIDFDRKLGTFLKVSKVCEKLGMSENPKYFDYVAQTNCSNELQIAFVLGGMDL